MSDSTKLTRRDWMFFAGAATGMTLTDGIVSAAVKIAERRKRIIVVGAGIGGLCCAFELIGSRP